MVREERPWIEAQADGVVARDLAGIRRAVASRAREDRGGTRGRETGSEKQEREAAEARAKEEQQLITIGAPYERRYEEITGAALDTTIPGYWGLVVRAARTRTDSALAAGDLVHAYLDDIAAGDFPAPDGVTEPGEEALVIPGMRADTPTFMDWCLRSDGLHKEAEPELGAELVGLRDPEYTIDRSNLIVPLPE